MMKSFFKKLAFVMALAMVVTLAAPAAQASAATALGIALQSAKSKEEVVPESSIEVGETVDYKYYFAPKNYKELNPTWTSSNPEVASVTQKGEVTGLKDGVTNVSITLSDGSTGFVAVTVGKGDVNPNAFEAAQISDTVATLTFPDNKDLTAAALTAGLEFYYYIGETKVVYPVEVKEVKDGVATIASYVFFVDGTKYGFSFAGETSEFVASIGEVKAVEATWKCEGDAFKAYVGADTQITAVLKNAQGIDITASALAAGGSVNYSLVKDAANGEYWISDASGKIFFNAKAAAQVKVSYVTGKYDEVTYEPIPGPETTISLVGSDAPAYAIDMTKGATATITTGAASAIDWSKASTVIALGDDNGAHKLAVKMTDNKGNDKVVTLAGSDKGTFSFKSTNSAVLFIDSNGTIMTNSVGTVNVLVSFQLNGSNASSVVAVVPVTVKPARAVATVDLDKTSAVISTEAGDDGKDYNKVEFKFTLKDQLDAKKNADSIVVTCNNANTLPNGATAAPAISDVTKTATGEYKVCITGAEANLPTSANGYTYTFTVKVNNSITKTFNVTVRKPIKDNGAYVISGYKVEFGGDSDIKTLGDTTGATVSALNANATLYLMSNGIKADVLNMTQKPAATVDMKAGQYYYTITKNGNALNLAVPTIDLTKLTPITNVSGVAGLLVDKNANGVGSYTVVVYKAVGNTANATASAFTQVTSNTLTVKDSQDTMGYAGKKTDGHSHGVATAADIVKDCFKFTIGGTTLAAANDYANNNIIVVPNANIIDSNKDGMADLNTVCFINSVDFYKLVGKNNGQNVYVKYTVNVGNYVEVK